MGPQCLHARNSVPCIVIIVIMDSILVNLTHHEELDPEHLQVVPTHVSSEGELGLLTLFLSRSGPALTHSVDLVSDCASRQHMTVHDMTRGFVLLHLASVVQQHGASWYMLLPLCPLLHFSVTPI